MVWNGLFWTMNILTSRYGWVVLVSINIALGLHNFCIAFVCVSVINSVWAVHNCGEPDIFMN